MKPSLTLVVRILFSMLLFMNLPAAFSAPMPEKPLKLFLLVGQSNMAGRGKVGPEDVEPIPGVWSFSRSGKWIPAVDPLHWDKPERAGVGPGRSFARELRRTYPEWEIGLIPCAFGGTRLDKWAPGSELFKNAVDRTKQALSDGELCGILWHQGEADSGRAENATTYAKRWTVFIQAVRAQLHAESVPVLVGGLGDFVSELVLPTGQRYGPFAEEVTRQLASLASVENKIGFVSAAGLSHIGDQLHFSAEAQREFGRRYAREFVKLNLAWTDEGKK